MPSQSVTGHAVNIANFELMIDRCTAFGTDYAPSNLKIALATMTTQYETVRDFQKDFLNGFEVSRTYINNHELLFAPLNPLVTCVINMLQSTEASQPFIRDAKAFADAIGARIFELPITPEKVLEAIRNTE